MSTAALEGLVTYLYGTLSINDMRWVAEHLTMHADQKESWTPKPMTLEEMHDRLDRAERDFEAGLGIPDEEAWDELEEMEREEKEALTLAETV